MLNIIFFLESTNGVLNDKAGSNWSMLEMVGQFIYLIIITAVVLFLLYYFIKFTSKVRVAKNQYGNLEVIESISVSFQNYVQIIRVGEKYILIGVNKDKITFLTEVDEKDLKFKDKEEENNNFQNYLSEHIRKILKKD